VPPKVKSPEEICHEADSRIQSLEQTNQTGQYKSGNYASRFEKIENSIDHVDAKNTIANWGVLGIQFLLGLLVAIMEITRK